MHVLLIIIQLCSLEQLENDLIYSSTLQSSQFNIYITRGTQKVDHLVAKQKMGYRWKRCCKSTGNNSYIKQHCKNTWHNVCIINYLWIPLNHTPLYIKSIQWIVGLKEKHSSTLEQFNRHNSYNIFWIFRI